MVHSHPHTHKSNVGDASEKNVKEKSHFIFSCEKSMNTKQAHRQLLKALDKHDSQAALAEIEQLLKQYPKTAAMTGDDGDLPLHKAVRMWMHPTAGRLVRDLLAAYPQAAHIPNGRSGSLPLHLAAVYQGGHGGADVVQALLEVAPSAWQTPTRSGELPVHLAARHQGGEKGTPVLEALLNADSASASMADAKGKLALHIAAQFQGGAQGVAVLQELLKAAPDAVEAADARGNIPLHYAACYDGGTKGTSVTELLLLSAAPETLFRRNGDGQTPLKLALMRMEAGFKHSTIKQLRESDALIHVFRDAAKAHQGALGCCPCSFAPKNLALLQAKICSSSHPHYFLLSLFPFLPLLFLNNILVL